MGDIKNYALDQFGVIADQDATTGPEGSFTKAQNAIADPRGNQGAIRKRPGLMPLNAVAGSGVVRGGVGVPIALGSAGPYFQNPFLDTPITVAELIVPVFSVAPALGAIFDDDAFEVIPGFDEDPEYDPDSGSLDVEGDGTTTASASVALTFTGNPAGDWELSLNETVTDHLVNTVAHPDTKILLFPTGRVNQELLNFDIAGGAAVTSTTSGVGSSPACRIGTTIYYADGNYTPGTDAPTIRAYDGYTDRVAGVLPFTTNDLFSVYNTRRVNAMIAVGSLIYIATMDNGNASMGSNAATGSVLSFNPVTGDMIKIGATFVADYVPVSLLWAYGMLWTGTAGNTQACRVYRYTDGNWVLDNTFSAGEAVVNSLASFGGKIYAAILNRTLAGTCRLAVRSTAGAWTNSDTGTLDTNGAHLSFRGYYTVMCWPPEDSGITSPAPTLYAVRGGCTEDVWPNLAIRRLSAGVWSSSYVDANIAAQLYPTMAHNGTKLVPVLWNADGKITNTHDGVTFTDRSAQFTGLAGFSYILPGLIVQV